MQKDPLVSFVEAENKLQEQAPVIAPIVEAPKVEIKAPIVEPKVEIKSEQKAETKEPEIIDLELPEAPETNQPAFDFTSLVKDLGIEVKTKDELVSKWKEAKEDPLKGIPDNLRKAVDFAKQGGDFLQMLKIGQVDYSQIDPTVLYESQIIQQIGKEKGKEYLESLSPLAKEVEGQRLKTQYIQWQKSQEDSMLNDLQAKATQELARKAENEFKLRDAVSKVDNIDGFKVKPAEKERFIKEVLDGSLSKALFMDDRGNFDYNKMLRVSFISKNFDAIKKHYGSKVATETKREVISNLTNAELQINSARPEGQREDEPSINPLDRWVESERKKKDPLNLKKGV